MRDVISSALKILLVVAMTLWCVFVISSIVYDAFYKEPGMVEIPPPFASYSTMRRGSPQRICGLMLREINSGKFGQPIEVQTDSKSYVRCVFKTRGKIIKDKQCWERAYWEIHLHKADDGLDNTVVMALVAMSESRRGTDVEPQGHAWSGMYSIMQSNRADFESYAGQTFAKLSMAD